VTYVTAIPQPPSPSATNDRRDRFERCYQQLYAPVSAYVLRRVSSPEAAAEIVAETFLTLWRRLDDAPAGNGLRPWTYGIARRVLANHLRGERRRTALTDRLVTDFARIVQQLPDPAESVTDRALLLAAIAQLSERDQELLRLVAWEGLSNDEIAVVLGVGPAAVRLRLHRARRRLTIALDSTADGKQPATDGQVMEQRELARRSHIAEGTR
jgi:RNA polymerase sigma-70 factor (ECF subfamily)